MESSTVNLPSGLIVDFSDPKAESFCLEDIATGLSGTCRFGAQTSVFYSVAQHAVLVSEIVVLSGRADLAREALNHDSHEAYMCDLPSPLKTRLPEFDEIAEKVDEEIAASLGHRFFLRESDEWAVIRRADEVARCVEAARVAPHALDAVKRNADHVELRDFTQVEHLWRDPLGPDAARDYFYSRAAALDEAQASTSP